MGVVKVLRTLKASFFLSILLILPICFSFSPSTAYAAESDAVAISGATQDFDLTKGPEQSHQIKLKDGTVAVIGIKKKPMSAARYGTVTTTMHLELGLSITTVLLFIANSRSR